MRQPPSNPAPRHGTRLALMLFSSLVLLGLPTAASARPDTPVSLAPEACPVAHIVFNVTYDCTAEFTLRGSNGYRITVSAEPSGGSGEVELSAEGHSGAVQYLAPGTVTATAIKASFGRLGKVSVRFRPSGAERRVRVPKRCLKGRPPLVTSRLGSFLGTIEFRGERGYTQVSAHRARGGIGDPLANTPKKLTCEFRESDAERKRELDSVSLDASPPGTGISFGAFRLFGSWSHQTLPGEPSPPRGDRYLFLASATEKSGRMSIVREAAAVGGSEDFAFDGALTSAKVTPPFPFTGSGSFLRNADGSTGWTGTLSAPLPGLGTVRLTGGGAQLETVASHLKRFEEEAKAH
jgi:hypothetical protein